MHIHYTHAYTLYACMHRRGGRGAWRGARISWRCSRRQSRGGDCLLTTGHLRAVLCQRGTHAYACIGTHAHLHTCSRRRRHAAYMLTLRTCSRRRRHAAVRRTWVQTCMYTYTDADVHIHMHGCRRAYTHTWVQTYMCALTYLRGWHAVYVYMQTCMCMCIC